MEDRFLAHLACKRSQSRTLRSVRPHGWTPAEIEFRKSSIASFVQHTEADELEVFQRLLVDDWWSRSHQLDYDLLWRDE